MKESKLVYDLSSFAPDEILDLSKRKIKMLKGDDVRDIPNFEKVKALILPKSCKLCSEYMDIWLANIELLVWPQIEFIPTGLFSGAKLKKIIFEKCGTIYNNAFSSSAIESFDFENVGAVCKGAFAYSNIVSVSFKNSSIDILPDEIFDNCKKLENIIGVDFIRRPNGHDEDSIHIAHIGINAFNNCNNLNIENLSFDKMEIGSFAFSACDKIKNVEIQRSHLGLGVFSKCNNLESVVWESSISRIPSKTFSLCKKLNTIKNVNNVTTVGESAFQSSGINTLDGFDSLKNIEGFAFANCPNLKELNNSTITVISQCAFYESGIEKVTLSNPKGISLHDSIFLKARKLKKVDFSKSKIQTIPSDCFSNTDELETVILPECLRKIGSCAFYRSGIKSINIPDSVKTISDRAFSCAQSLEKISWSQNCAIINSRMFLGCIKLSSIEKIENIKAIKAYAFSDTTVSFQLYTFHDIATSAFEDFRGIVDLSMCCDIDNDVLSKILTKHKDVNIVLPYYML